MDYRQVLIHNATHYTHDHSKYHLKMHSIQTHTHQAYPIFQCISSLQTMIQQRWRTNRISLVCSYSHQYIALQFATMVSIRKDKARLSRVYSIMLSYSLSADCNICPRRTLYKQFVTAHYSLFRKLCFDIDNSLCKACRL